VNRKVKDLAKISALSAKAKDNKIIVVEDTLVQIEKPGTKQFNQVFLKINNGSRKSLFVTPEYDEIVYKSFRNVPSICGTLLSDINTYDIVNADSVIFTESAAKIFVEENETAGTEAEVKETNNNNEDKASEA